jgi:hypothetical protein
MSLRADRPAPADPERRSGPRLAVPCLPGRVAWRGTGLRMRKVHTQLLDFGPGGARVRSWCELPEGRFVWVGLESLPLEWVKAVARRPDGASSSGVYRLVFLEPCPAGILERLQDGEAPADDQAWSTGLDWSGGPDDARAEVLPPPGPADPARAAG